MGFWVETEIELRVWGLLFRVRVLGQKWGWVGFFVLVGARETATAAALLLGPEVAHGLVCRVSTLKTRVQVCCSC